MQDTVILGAGLAGLSTAYHLKSRYDLFEKKPHPGGLVITHSRDGFYFDVTGHWLHMRDAGIKRLVGKLMAGKMVSVARDSRIFSKGVETFYPFQTNTYGLPTETIKEIISGFINDVLLEPDKSKSKTFEQWVIKYMGRGIAKHFMIPYNEKLWCTHPKNMTPLWCQHYIPKPTLDQILEGALKPPEDTIGYNATFSYPIKGGIGRLSEALADALPTARIHYETYPKNILAKKRQLVLSNGETIGYNSLVSSIPLPELIRLIDDAPATVKKAASLLVHNEVRYFNIALKSSAGSPAHWLYYPEKKFVFYRAGCYSNAVASMAPKGCSSLYVEISHRGKLPTEKDLWRKVEKGLLECGLVRKRSDILFQESRNIKHAYVVFDQNYSKSLKTIMPWLEKYGIHSIGRYGKWTYNSMESALINGRSAAKQIRRSR